MDTIKTPFFDQYGDEIIFQDNFDLIRKLSHIDCSVPKRTHGRRSWHRERYCLKFYLMRLFQNNLLNFPFPLKIRKHEAPDFLILSSDGKMMGLEVTEASTEDHQRVMTELEKSPQGTMLMTLDLFNLEKSPLPKGEYKKALWKPGEKSIGKVWGNSEVKRVWIDIILSTIIEKTKSLNKLNFKTADRYELLVYDNSHVAEMLNSRYALPLLRKAIGEKLNLASYDRNFHSISVIHIEGLLYDVANKGLVLKAETDNTA